LAAAAFDEAAAAYDAVEAGNRILRWMRARVQDAALAAFDRGARLLEVGCGTGTDALFFAQRGYRVVALDPAGEMLATANAKIAAAKLAGAVEFHHGSAESLEEWREHFGAASFDGLFSNFGALNCVADLRRFARGAALLLRPGGKMLLCLMPPICPWEIGYYLFKRQPAEAFRRWRGRSGTGGISARVGNRQVQTYYHSRAAMEAAFSPEFELEKQFSLGLLAPPPYLREVVRHQKFFNALLYCEKLVAGWPLLRNWGDHVVVILRKRPAG
jgi:ubiquinone/menaquinone biosynthesis C-methylase UbiE